MGYHYEPDGRSYESVTVNAKLQNLDLRDRLQFGIATEVLVAEHQELNSRLRWDFSLKPLAHLKSDFEFRYGKDLDSNDHLVRITHEHGFSGDFDTFKKLDIENKVGLTISCFDFDKSAALSLAYNFVEEPRVLVEVGLKSSKDDEASFKYEYQHVGKNPVEINSHARVVYRDFKLIYRNHVQETAPHEYEGKAAIDNSDGKVADIDYTYKIKKEAQSSHRELKGTIQYTHRPDPVKIEGSLDLSPTNVIFHVVADRGPDLQPISVDVKLDKTGHFESSVSTPRIEGSAEVDWKQNEYSIKADIKSKFDEDKRLKISGGLVKGAINTLNLDLVYEPDADTKRELSIKAKSNRESEDGHSLTASINYGGSINVEFTGKVNADMLRGPHHFRADFSGNMEPMAIEYNHEIKGLHLSSVVKYLRSNSEKLRLNMKGDVVMTGSKFEVESGISISSPYKTFDGKEIYYRLMAESTDTNRVFITEYRIRPAKVINYVGKLDYNRKRGFPGHIRSTVLVATQDRPIYEGSTHLDYGNGRYVWKSSFSPASKRKVDLVTSFEHSGKFAAFHHTMNSALQYLQKVELHAVADVRSTENATIYSNFDVNEHKVYDVNSTLKMLSMIDFDFEMLLFSRITPSIHVFSKAQTTSGERSVTKYDFNLDVDKNTILSGTGELKKRKKGFNGDFAFTYKESEFLSVAITQEAKSQRERNYNIKVKTPKHAYSSAIRVHKEKKGSAKYETQFCRTDDDKCITLNAHRTHNEHIDEWHIDYKRGDIDFSIERIREHTDILQRYHTVIHKGEKRYGYDLRLEKEDQGRSISLGVILPSREVKSKTYAEFSLRKPRVKFELNLDARKHPERTLVIDTKIDNHLLDHEPSKVEITISHPIYEKPIELIFIGNLNLDSDKFFEGEIFQDFSNDPDDKKHVKISLEKFKDNSGGTLMVTLYAAGEEYSLKSNISLKPEDKHVGFYWKWRDDAKTPQEAFTVYHRTHKHAYFEINRPNFIYKLEADVVSPESLLAKTMEIDVKRTWNEDVKNAKLIVNFEDNCHDLFIFNDQGEKIRTVELCILSKSSRKLVSVIMESIDNEGEWQLDYSFEAVRKSWKTLNFRHYINPEFSGTVLFRLTSLVEELRAAGVGVPPFWNTESYKKIRQAFHTKLFQPTIRFLIPEAAKFIADVRKDSMFLAAKLNDYYKSLPVAHSVHDIRLWLRGVAKEAWSNVENYYRERFQTFINFVEKSSKIVSIVCSKNEDCNSLVEAYKERGLAGLCDQIQMILQALPAKIENFILRSDIDARKFYDKAMVVVKAAVRPLTKYKCGELIFKIVELTYVRVEPKIQNFLENYPQYYREAKEAITTNPHVLTAVKVSRNAYLRLRTELRKIDFPKLIKMARKHLEDCFYKMSPPSLKSGFKINAFNLEKGIVDYDLYLYSLSDTIPAKMLRRALAGIVHSSVELLSEHPSHYVSRALATIKRVADLNFFPPYKAQAMIIDNQQYVTFDGAFFEFEGECTYLLTKDFEDGNFTFALTPKEGEKEHSILAMMHDVSIEVNTAKQSVHIGDDEVELPYSSDHFVISRRGDSIILSDRHGVKVKCNLVHRICTFGIDGYYFGKTAGMLGTYNYEKYDEFKRPKGQIANSAAVHAKSWELKKGCKPNNLVPEAKISENAEYYRTCKEYFKNVSSPLSACFYEVPATDYFDMCLRLLSRADDKKKALCQIAAAYVTDCERNYVELNLPSKCLTCTAPDGKDLTHGDRKKYEHVDKKHADVVFIIEDNACNKKAMNDINNLAKSIDRELLNDGYKDVNFGVIGYGGKIGKPEIYTVKGHTLFSSRDMASIKDRFGLESEKEDARAFEAMKMAVNYLFRSESAKSIVLLSCSACKYDFKSLQYPVVQQILLERGITLHVIHPSEISIRKYANKEKDIIGVDPDTVYHSKDVTQKDLTGEPSLRSHVSLPKDLCIALAQDVGGSFFTSAPLGSSNDKNWRSVFSRKFLKSVTSSECQTCDCTSSRDHTPRTVCQPCESKRPRLPFSRYLSTETKYF